MTGVVTEQVPPAQRQKQWGRQRNKLGDHVAKTVGILQGRLFADSPQPEAVATLARLRRGIGREPGYDYTLEKYLAVPEQLLGFRPADDSEAADTEHAKHAALTLYALHQQSRRERMHVDGRGLGLAVAELVRKSTGPDGVRRRFSALGTAATYDEAIYHLRSLTTMLREHHVPIDYGLLADDLQTLRRPGGRTHVQAAWGREFFRSRPSDSDEADTDTDTDKTEETAS